MAETDLNTPRDVSQIDTSEFENRNVPQAAAGRREARFQAVVRQSALNKVHRHGLSQDAEVCGVLVGNIYRDAAGPWLYVEHAIEGDHARERDAQVTFTAETWAHIQGVMDKEHADKRIVGWYHTHPGFGIFLSEMDLFIQENFFPLPWQVALVYDPKAGEEGLFVWRENAPQVEPFLIEGDAPREHETMAVHKAKDVSSGAGSAADAGVLAQRLEAVERRQRTILILLAVVGLIALAWPLIVSAFLPNLLKPRDHPAPIPLQSDESPGRPTR